MLEVLKNKKYRLILVLFLICVLLFMVTFSFKQKGKETQIVPTPTVIIPTLQPTPTIKEEVELNGVGTPNFYEKTKPKILENYPLFDYIPYKTDLFSLDYQDPMILEVVLKEDTLEIRQEVLDWISSKGVDPKTHTIIWKTQ